MKTDLLKRSLACKFGPLERDAQKLIELVTQAIKSRGGWKDETIRYKKSINKNSGIFYICREEIADFVKSK